MAEFGRQCSIDVSAEELKALEWKAAVDRGLNMSYSARMERARQMGYTTLLYRGTGGQQLESGIYWASPDPKFASEYAELRSFQNGCAGYVEPVLARLARGVEFYHAEQRKKISEFLSEVMAQANKFADERTAHKIYTQLRDRYDAKIQEINQYWRDPMVAEFIRLAGFDHISVFEGGRRGTATIGVLDLSNVRSVNAAFHPGFHGAAEFPPQQHEKTPRLSLDDFDASLRKDRVGKYSIVRTGTIIGEIWLKEGLNEVADVRVEERFRGRGYANAAYDAIEKDTGVTIEPSDNLSKAGFKLWTRRDPGKVADSLYHCEELLLGKLASDGNSLGEIVEVRNHSVSIRAGRGITLPVSRVQLIDQGLIPHPPTKTQREETARITPNLEGQVVEQWRKENALGIEQKYGCPEKNTKCRKLYQN